MRVDWRKIIIPTFVLALVVMFYFYVAVPLLSRPDLQAKAKTAVMIAPILFACVIVAFVLTRNTEE